MFSRHPAPFGAPPSEVVFDGIEPGAPIAQLLYHQHQAEIGHFQGKARQNREISDQPGAHMQQALPDGGQLRYSYNNGLEVVHVKLSPKVIEAAEQQLVARKIEQRLEPLLAIDVLFTPTLYLSGDVYSFTRTTVTEREWLWEEGDPIPVDEGELIHTQGQYYNGSTFDDPIGNHFHREQEILGEVVIVSGSNSAQGGILTDDDITFLPTVPPSRSGIYIYHATHVHFLENSQAFEGTYWLVTLLSQWDPSMDFVPTWTGRLGDPFDVVDQVNVRDQTLFFDTLNVAGARVTPPDAAPYEAVNTAPSHDARLRSLADAGAGLSIARVMHAADTAPGGVVGAGFLARPRTPVEPTVTSPAPTVIDIYLASINTVKANVFPGVEGATFEADDPSFTYGHHNPIVWAIRVREFVDETLTIVRVDPQVQKRTKHWTAPEPGAGSEPTVEGAPVDSDSGRDESWKFAVGKGWRDLGGEPSDPLAPGMGRMLAEDSGSKTVAGPPGEPRTVHTVATWSGSVAGMTKVATISWTPPVERGKHGTATITPA